MLFGHLGPLILILVDVQYSQKVVFSFELNPFKVPHALLSFGKPCFYLGSQYLLKEKIHGTSIGQK